MIISYLMIIIYVVYVQANLTWTQAGEAFFASRLSSTDSLSLRSLRSRLSKAEAKILSSAVAASCSEVCSNFPWW